MKIIDLLNKIANDEDVPKKIKYDNEDYWYDYGDGDYHDENNESLFGDLFERCFTKQFINNQIEIVEKGNKIHPLEYYDNSISWCMNGREINDNEKDIIDKINELIDEINKLKENNECKR